MAERQTTDSQDTGAGQPAPVSAFRAGFYGRCPVCGEGALFNGMLALHTDCGICGADLRAADPGDGPAVFVILILGAITTLAAIAVESWIGLPLWAHAILWPVFVVAGAIWMLRVIKGTLIALQFKHDAREGRLDYSDTREEDEPT